MAGPRRPLGPAGCDPHSKIALLKSAEGKLNDNQRKLVDTLAAAGGKVSIEALQALEVPRTTLGTLSNVALIEIVEEPAAFTVSNAKPRPNRSTFI